jgi:hypothetical protein
LAFTTGTKNLPISIVSISPTQITLTVPPGVAGRSYTFSLTTPTGLTKSIGFSQQTAATPKINLISALIISPNVVTTVILNNTILGTIIPEKVYIYSISNPDFIYTVTSWTNSSTQLSFNVTLNSGKYGFKLYDDLYGWYNTANVVLSVSKSSTSYTISNTQTSFNGGVFTINGDYIGDGATITVNGLKGSVLTRTSTSAIFNVP